MTAISMLAATERRDGADGPSGAMIYAADKYSRGLGAPGSRESRTVEALTGDSGQPDACSGAKLPQGYLPVHELKDMTLLGRWPVLEDRMSPCMPARMIAAMRRREALGDHDAEAWLTLHAQACAGDPDAQRTFGRVCENGACRAPADLQRAFFWYYRAGLQGDLEARRSAERLMRATRICPATMAEPMLVHAGRWRITAHLSERLHSTSVFALADDGNAAGWLIGHGEAVDEWADDAAAVRGTPDYRGGWAYDGYGQVLTIIFDVAEGAARRWRGANWQIELLGCKPGAIFGRDLRRVGYTLERLDR